ncbi:MAG: transposase [Verrucomicrobia bacterium]|nr:MAG: transposase [Verrucomicrobiota bacterium]
MVSLAEVLRQYWPQYERQFGSAILPSHRRAVQAILNCRTSALGGQVFRCVDCRKDHFVYHSCNHRACPQCGQTHAADWVEQQRLKLLPVPYYLITFTVPEGLRQWLRSHQKQGYALLLRQSAATLQDVAVRPKYLGAELGILSVLHTWGRQLQFHPHVHCVVPAGGLRPDGLRWCRPPSPEFFLPQKLLAARFRNRLKAALPPMPDSNTIPSFVWRQPWVVDVQPAGSGQTAIKYLAAYVYHTALGSQRILSAHNNQLTFKYKDSADQQWRVLQLCATEFLRRFLQHVLPKGFQRVRYFGWLSPAAKSRWQRILALLDWKAPLAQVPPATPPPTCLGCHKPMTLVGHFARPPPRFKT